FSPAVPFKQEGDRGRPNTLPHLDDATAPTFTARPGRCPGRPSPLSESIHKVPILYTHPVHPSCTTYGSWYRPLPRAVNVAPDRPGERPVGRTRQTGSLAKLHRFRRIPGGRRSWG